MRRRSVSHGSVRVGRGGGPGRGPGRDCPNVVRTPTCKTTAVSAARLLVCQCAVRVRQGTNILATARQTGYRNYHSQLLCYGAVLRIRSREQDIPARGSSRLSLQGGTFWSHQQIVFLVGSMAFSAEVIRTRFCLRTWLPSTAYCIQRPSVLGLSRCSRPRTVDSLKTLR